VAESLALVGYDWLLLDGEHAPNDPRSILQQLRAVAPYPVQPVVRPVIGDVALVKQYLDVGAQTLLVPMIDSAEQAEQMVQAMRYAPSRHPRRGCGAGARVALQPGGRLPEGQANEQMCLLVQAETDDRDGQSARHRGRPRAWTACSSARPTCPRRWG
jgi:4-hydroxy-2-oxoheptanedioate aldolase